MSEKRQGSHSKLTNSLVNEDVPRQANGENSVMGKKATEDDVIVRTVEFQNKRFARSQGTESGLAAWLQKVHFIHVW